MSSESGGSVERIDELRKEAEAFPSDETLAAKYLRAVIREAGSEDAMALAITSRRKFPKSEEILQLYAAIAAATRGGASEALSASKELVDLNPASSYNHCLLGSALLLSDQAEEATAELRKSIDLDSNYVNARTLLVAALVRQGDLAGAQRSFAEAISEVGDKPGFAEAKITLLEAQEDYEAALKVSAQFGNMDHPKAFLKHAWLLAKTGRRDEYLFELDAFYKRNPLNSDVCQMLAREYMRRGHRLKAIGLAFRGATRGATKFGGARRSKGALRPFK